MRVAVIGSWRKETIFFGWQLKNESYFQILCYRIGQRLAEKKHQLVVARTSREKNNKIADIFVSDGYKSKSRESVNPDGNHPESKVWAKAHISCVQESDAVIVIGGSDGTYIAGQTAIMLGKRLISIPFFGGAAEELCSDYRNKIDKGVLSVDLPPDSCSVSDDWIDDLIDKIMLSLMTYPRVLVIHGRSEDKQILKKILKEVKYKINIHSDPIVMSDVVKEAEPVSVVFERLASQSDCAIAIITPDDIGCNVVDEKGGYIKGVDVLSFSRRARQNIWVEVGWFWGRLGSDRLMLLVRGDVEYPSDVGPFIRHTYKKSPIELKSDIKSFIDKISSKMKFE
jgi:predicted nucleotide-binding protein